MGIFVLGIGDSQKKTVPSPPEVDSFSDSGSNRAFDDGAAFLTFAPTPFDGKLPIIDYQVTATSETNQTVTFTLNSLTSYVLTGLKSGLKYRYKIKARNALGYGSDSTEKGPASATTVPGRPTSLGVVDVRNGGSLDLAWIAPSNGGAPIKGYIITPSVGNTIDTGNTGTSYRYSGTVGNPVSFTVAAYNDNGTGQASTVSIAVSPSAAPVTTTTTPTPSGGGVSTTCAQASYVTSVSGGSTITINGFFDRPVTNVSWNGTNLGSFSQNSTTITFTRPAAESATIQVFNGCLPLMSSLSYTYSVAVATCTIPSNLIGTTLSAASTALQNAGYVPLVGAYTTTSDITQDQIVRTFSAPSSSCGSTVTLNAYQYQAPAVSVTCGAQYGTVAGATQSVGFGPYPSACTGYLDYTVTYYKCSDGSTSGTSFAVCGTLAPIITPVVTTTPTCFGPCLGTWTINAQGICQCISGTTATPTATATATTPSTTVTTSPCVPDFVPCCACTSCCGGYGGRRYRNTCSGATSAVECNPAPASPNTTVTTTPTSPNTTVTTINTGGVSTVYTSPNTTVTTRTTTTRVPSGCLVGHTLISTPNGLVKAEDLKVGDLVNSVRFAELSTDETVDSLPLWNSRSLTPVYMTNTVIKSIVVKKEVDFYLNLNGDHMTPEHPVLVRANGKHQFMLAGDIHIGYEVLKRTGPGLNDLIWVPVVINDIIEEPATVYLFDAEEDDVIFTENMLTHNLKLLML